MTPKFPGFRDVIRRDAEHHIELVEAVIEMAIKRERTACAKIAYDDTQDQMSGFDIADAIMARGKAG